MKRLSGLDLAFSDTIGGLSEDRKGVVKWYPVQKTIWSTSFSVWLSAKETVLVWGLRVVISGTSLEVFSCWRARGAFDARSEMRRGCFDTALIWAAMSIPDAECPTTITFCVV